jgi:REP element-mobilizing transposase RayT
MLKANRYNIFDIKMQLIFAFDSPDSVQDDERQILQEILPHCARNLPFTVEQVALLTEGVELLLTMSPGTEISMLVNALKTHSAKQLGELTGRRKSGLWLRGYGAHSLGELPAAATTLAALIAKNRREK